MGRRRSYTMAFEGIVASLERRYKETDSAQQRERIEEYMSFRPVRHLQRRAAEAGGARGHDRRPVDQRVHEACR
jgi:excinuclease UvrABC ATPase subunit